MRLLFTMLFLGCFWVSAQERPEYFCKQINEIANAERVAHQRLNGTGIAGTGNITGAGNTIDVKYYRCEWDVDPAIRYIKGKITIYYLTTASTGFIDLDLLSPLVADSVFQRTTLLTKSQTSTVLTINLPGLVAAGTFDSVSIYYQGVPPNTGFGSFIQSTHSSTPVMWSLSEPYGSRDWWPCKNGLDDKADSLDVIVTNPAAYKAASNGIIQYDSTIAGGTKRIAYWKHRYPIASYLICFAVTNYSVFNNTVQLGTVTLPMQTYCYPENLTSFQNGTINTLNAMQLFHSIFGDYPFINEKYGHVQFGWGGGMEHQTSTFIVNIGENLCAHELGHQWFGDKITCGTWKDIWLNEGFATHLASIYYENKYPANIISSRKNEINNITAQLGGSVIVDDTTSVNRIFDSRLSYSKGSHLLYMLRWILSDSIFFAAIRNYQADPLLKYGFATTPDLKRHLEQASGKDLTYFFNDWYTGQGYPTYNVEWANVGLGNVQIKMNQTTSHVSVPFYELPVPLLFKNATQQTTVVVDNTVNGEVFYKSIGFIPDTVIIDPNYWLITRNNTSTKKPDVVLPVNLIDFKVNNVNCTADIRFTTAVEIDLATFEIEYSNDGFSYNKLTVIKAKGNSASEHKYNYAMSLMPGKDYFFRLKMINTDGSFDYSAVNKVSSCKKTAAALISPNPVKSMVTISGLNDGNNTIKIFASNGQLVKSLHTQFNVVKSDMSKFSSGTYLVQITDADGNMQQQKLIKE